MAPPFEGGRSGAASLCLHSHDNAAQTVKTTFYYETTSGTRRSGAVSWYWKPQWAAAWVAVNVTLARFLRGWLKSELASKRCRAHRGVEDWLQPCKCTS